jgi:hypothetical protein
MGIGKKVGEVLDMCYHRNGTSGRGFWTILFKGHSNASSKVAGHTFVATYFPGEESADEDPEDYREAEAACVAVLRLGDLDQGHANQCWRGDAFESELATLVDNFIWPHERGVEPEATFDPSMGRRAAIKAQKAKKEV